MPAETIRLLISCPDTRGIIAAVSAFIAQHAGNIVELDQHTDDSTGWFFMRVEVEAEGFGLSRLSFGPAWSPLAARFSMDWSVRWGGALRRVVILASREGHCLHDLLFRWKAGELTCEIPLVLSNHEDLRPIAESAGVPFRCVTGPDKTEQEQTLLRMIRESRAELIVLARYMQVLSPVFVAAYPNGIINIHHSFLPAFAGPRPYHQAFERGVKLIGATSHYVTDSLDQGPIIAQQTAPVGHRDNVQSLIRKGRDLERVVLARSVRLHLNDQTIVACNKTIVFD
ncbi:MAG: formyltetrahydrofolate deformylase [Phycisphaerae bacterium]|nr:formyltetrahydrofolate deformylase [Phycisphaerae bacterium]